MKLARGSPARDTFPPQLGIIIIEQNTGEGKRKRPSGLRGRDSQGWVSENGVQNDRAIAQGGAPAPRGVRTSNTGNLQS